MEYTNEEVENFMNDYYKLKNKYDTLILKNKKKILNNQGLSAKEKRSEFLKLKPKCINCERPGGTIFSTKYYPVQSKKIPGEESKDDEYRELTAKCGIIADPCNLNIKIQLGIYELLPDILREIETEIKDNKNEIIDSKNKLLFGYITTDKALQDYESIKDYVSHFTSLLEQYLEMYLNITDNIQKQESLNEDIERTYELIEQIKLTIVQFNELESSQYVRDAVNIYITELMPLLSKISSLKYKENFVFYNENLNTYHLIQKKYNIESLEYSSFRNKVIAYDVGLKMSKKKKPTMIIESSESESKDISISDKEKKTQEGMIAPDEGIYNGDRITWTNPTYQTLWDKLPEKFKQALASNNEWMNDFMYNCVNARAKNENCKFTTPNDLMIPPEMTETGEYNFGNDIYNNMFNKLDKTYQNTLLTLYSEKNGEKNYSMLIDTLNKLLAKDLGYESGYF